MSKVRIKRWHGKRVEFSWSDIARHEFELYGEENPMYWGAKIIRERIAKRIYRKNKKRGQS